jgi:hypothetical protein
VEHLLIGAFVFPLLIKALLAGESFYSLTADDIGASRAVDKLLSTNQWGEMPEESSSNETRWSEIIGDEILHAHLEEGWRDWEKEHPGTG